MSIINSKKYQEAENFRTQCSILKNESKQLQEPKYKLTYDQIGFMFNMTGNANKKHCLKANNPNIKPNGHPFILNDIEIQEIKSWINMLPNYPSKDALSSYIEGKYNKFLDRKSIKIALQKLQMKIETASPMDEDRYYASKNVIDFYFSMIEAFCNDNEIPAHFVLNLDEEGYEEFADSKKLQIVVPQEDKSSEYYYPVRRSNDHMTFLSCIAADGSYLKPLIILKRKTIDARYFRIPLADKLMLGFQENGFINSGLFDEWLETVFVPFIQERRNKFDYSGPALLILDGCSFHYTKKFFEICDQNNVMIFFLPAHSSNQTQPLDLGMFHLHKSKLRKITFGEDDLVNIEKIREIFSSFQSVATVSNIKGAFEAAGAVYEVSDSLIPIIHFSKSFATKLLDYPKGKAEKKEIRQKRSGWDQEVHRIKISDLNSQEKVKKVLEKVPFVVDRPKLDDSSVLSRLLNAFVPVKVISNEAVNENKRGRPKKEETAFDPNYSSLSFNEKLELELESLDLL